MTTQTTCKRCNGKREIESYGHVNRGICFNCGGSGIQPPVGGYSSAMQIKNRADFNLFKAIEKLNDYETRELAAAGSTDSAEDAVLRANFIAEYGAEEFAVFMAEEIASRAVAKADRIARARAAVADAQTAYNRAAARCRA